MRAARYGKLPCVREQWRSIPGHPKYDVSDLGRVRSWKVVGAPKRTATAPTVLRPSVTKRGYQHVILDGRRWPVHHLVLEAFVASRPFPRAETRHLDGDPSHNWPTNLLWGTRADNAADKRRHGTHNHAKRQTCRRRGHALVPPNLDLLPLSRGNRCCYSCKRGKSDVVYLRKAGFEYDQDVLADQWYGHLMEGSPRPRSTPELHRAALVGPEPPPRGYSAPRAIRVGFSPGDRFTIPDAWDRMRRLGVVVEYNAVTLALARCVDRGVVEKEAPGLYRRLPDGPVLVRDKARTAAVTT